MPELPEVETIRRQLAPALRGKRIERLEVIDSKWGSPIAASELAGLIESRTIEQLSRRGKYLIFDLGDELYLICHLRMTGNFLYDAEPDVAYQRALFELGGGHTLRFTDPRRFGTAEVIIGAGALDEYFAGRLGIEPFSGALDGTALKLLASGKRTSIKAFLLDQRAVAGIGNIYADEALFRAEVHPLREAGRSEAGPVRATRRQRFKTRSKQGSTLAAQQSMTFATPTASTAASKTSSWFTGALANLARDAAYEVREDRRRWQGHLRSAAAARTRPRGAVTRRAAPRASRSGQRP